MTSPATKSIDTTLDSIDSLIADWQDWEAEDAKPNPKTAELRRQFDAARPALSQALTMATQLRNALGAMSSLRHQVEQMRGMFDDADGTMQEACNAHDETEQAVLEALNGSTIDHAPTLINATIGENHYLVGWQMDIWAESPREAALKAFAVQQRPDSTANVFTVTDEDGNGTIVDLEEPVQEAPDLQGPR